MILEPLPEVKRFRILAGGPVRKNPDILRPCLESAAAQILPPNVTLDYMLCDDNVLPDSSEYLRSFCEQHKGIYLDCRSGDAGDFSDNWGSTHQWTPPAMQRVGQIKNQLIKEALSGQYDALWLFDADLLFSPRTLWSLYYTDAPIACGAFWTQWARAEGMPWYPQVWLQHPYDLSGRGMAQHEFLRRLHNKERIQVWGQGANTLYRTDVFRKGVSFEFLEDLPKEGLWQGEDRHLCTRAERLHVPMIADAWPRVFHVYHPHQVNDIAFYQERFAETPGRPNAGDWVSLHLHAIEPIPTTQGAVRIEKQHVRGRLGRLPLMDDLEAAVCDMERGESRIVSVRFPDWSEPQLYRGQKRLIEATLVDFMPHAPEVWDG